MTTPTAPTRAEILLPCPFCGSSDIEPDGVAFYKDGKKENGLTHAPACNDCNATSDNWNARPVMDNKALLFSLQYWNEFCPHRNKLTPTAIEHLDKIIQAAKSGGVTP